MGKRKQAHHVDGPLVAKNLGEPMEHMFRAVNRILEEFEDVKVVYPIHKNQSQRELASKIFWRE